MTSPLRRAVFFDRDGVLNKAMVRNGKPYPPIDVAEMEIPPAVLPALESVKRLGFVLVGASNQPDVARKTTTRETVEAINRRLLDVLPLEEILICCHDDCDDCACRKPKPGLLLEAAEKYGIDLAASFMIGDRWRDVEAGRRAGCKTIWINYHYDEAWPVAAPDYTVSSLAEAVQCVIQSIEKE
jgi:D-glycero-D-manno-heptose 1,7-bisphosphate phosphatase